MRPVYFLVLLFSSLLVADTGIGNLKGTASVEQGTLHYSVDILTPPGIAGVEPKLSFEYSQNGGSGILGKGWQIGGLSAISRCGSTVAQDGINRGVVFNSTDNYCLDGQRLVAVKGAKGESGTEYRTEIDSYSRIVSYGSSGNGPDHFIVYTKSGDVYEYGATPDAKVSLSDGTAFTWLVNKISDHLDNDNDIVFIYNDEHALKEVSYAGGHNRVVFGYEDRGDKKRLYTGGKLFSYTKRLQRVALYAYGKNIRNYWLRYDNQGAHGSSRLMSVQECDRGACLEPLSFSYSDHFTAARNIDIKMDDVKNRKTVFNADFNNDGISDLYITDGDGSTDVIKLGTADGQFSGGTIHTGLNLSTRLFFVDINGDGYLDIYETHKRYHGYRLGNGKGSFGSEHRLTSIHGERTDIIKFADFDGDGKIDIFYKTTKRPGGIGDYTQAFYIINPRTYEQREIALGTPKTISFYGYDEGFDGLDIADMNNDGLVDILNDGRVWINRGNFTFTAAQNFYANIFSSYNLQDIRLADFNADGYVDVYVLNYKKADAIWINDGTGHFIQQNFPVNCGNHKDDLIFADFDQDGYTDIYNKKSKQLWINRAKWINGWDEKFAQSDNFYADIGTGYLLVGDFNGDGAVDIADKDHQKLWLNGVKRVFLQTVTDSFENKTKFSFKPLTDKEVYSRKNVSYYYGSSAYVVSNIQTFHGSRKVEDLSYHYYDLMISLFGRGSLGFREVDTTDNIQKRIEKVEYLQYYPFTGRAAKQEVFLENGTKISSVVNDYINRTYYYGTNVKEVYLRKTIKNDFVKNIQITQRYVYDKYGNVLILNDKTVDNNNGETFTKTTESSYHNDPNRWILGRLVSSKVVHEGGDVDTYIEKSSEYTYNDDGLLESETVKGDGKELTKTYRYDTYGNKIEETISGSDIDTRTTTYRYDSNGHFLIRVEKPMGMSESYVWDKGLGKMVATIPNDNTQLKVTYSYDPFGKLLSKSVPGVGATTYRYDWDNSAPGSLYNVTVTAPGSAPVVTCYDSFDRKVRIEKTGYDGRKIYEDKYYNDKGEMYKATVPHYDGEDIAWVQYSYDAFGRPVSTCEPSPSAGQKCTKIEYKNLTTTTTNAKGQTKKVTKNALGKTVKVEDADGNTITYEYDALGNLCFTTNGSDAAIETRYDAFGNKIYMNDPDMGEWHYSYDVLGELISQTDAKGQTTRMKYDKLGRLIAKDSANVHYEWVYDIAFKGKLSRERSNGGFEKSYTYDRFGRVIAQTTTIDRQTYTEKFAYDSAGRVVSVTKPKNFVLKHDYNRYGYLTAIKTSAGNIEQMSEERMKELITKAFKSINDYREKALEYIKKVQKLSRKANYYAYLARYYKSNVEYAKRLKKYAQELRSYAAYYQRLSIRYNSYAAYYQRKADRLRENAKKYSWWWRGFLNWIADYYARQAEKALNLAKRYANYAKFYNSYANWVDYYAERIEKYSTSLADYYMKEAKKVALEAKQAALKAKSYAQMANSVRQASSAYQEMMADRDYTYFYKVLAKDALGRTTSYIDGNGLINQTHYDASGVINYMTTGYGGDEYLRNISYTYDDLGNVLTRVDEALGINQDFEYDELNRVVSAQTGGNNLYIEPMTYEYDANGNILYKSDIGSYTYADPAHIHAVTNAGNRHYAYDANGNMTDNNGIKIRYNRFNKPVEIRGNGSVVRFAYDPEGTRYKKSTDSYTTHYLGKGYEHIAYANGSSEDKYYIYADGKVQAIHTNGSDKTFETRYLHYDALGSVDTITDMQGEAIQRAVYLPFGKKIVVDNEGKRVNTAAYTDRGYTGHEHIEEFNDLIHMNGRVYDSAIGRFISADPHIQAPTDTQSYNRYSYVKNNPLKYTDPGGYFFSGLQKWFSHHWKAIVTTVATVAVGVLTGGTSLVLQGSAIGFTAGATGTLVNGGSIGQALRNGMIGGLFGAVSAGFTYGIGSAFGGNMGAKALAHGALNSFMTRARGGRWNSGFWAGFAGTMLSPITGMARGYYAKIASSAFVAGTISQITGGKFANGAFSGAFRFMFNEWYHDLKNRVASIALEQLPSKLGKKLFNRYWSGVGGTYKLTDEEFKSLVDLSSRPNYMSISQSYQSGVSYYGTIEARAIGSAAMYYDEHWDAIGFYDVYDFDMRLENYIPDMLGGTSNRSIFNEFITDVTSISGALFGAKGFKVCYGAGCQE